MTQVVLDTSALIAVLLEESQKARLIDLTRGAQLIAPASVHWEVGNAFSAMFKKHAISLRSAVSAIRIYERIPIRWVGIDLRKALDVSHRLGIYAYDAYVLVCGMDHKAPLLTLDGEMRQKARALKVSVLEV